MAEVQVSLNQFEGPLGLLLFLIRKEEMDIFDIDIFEITNQYLAYVKNLKSLDLEGAGDFIAMASTLIQIKSRMLLPREALDDEEEYEDPRKELVKKLLEHQKYQEASKVLYDRPLLGRDFWVKGAKERDLKRPDDVVKVDDNPLYSLILHYRTSLKRAKKVIHRVGAKIQSIASRVLEVKVNLIPGRKMMFSSLSEVPSDFTVEKKSRLLITFLTLLELTKMGYLNLFQSQNYADIHIDTKADLSGDVVSQVEDYDRVAELDLIDSEPFADVTENVQSATDEEIEQAELALGDGI